MKLKFTLILLCLTYNLVLGDGFPSKKDTLERISIYYVASDILFFGAIDCNDFKQRLKHAMDSLFISDKMILNEMQSELQKMKPHKLKDWRVDTRVLVELYYSNNRKEILCYDGYTYLEYNCKPIKSRKRIASIIREQLEKHPWREKPL